VDPKYDALASTALGGNLNQFVVTQQTIGLKLAQIVRENNAGRISIIPLDKVHITNGWQKSANEL